MVGWLYHPCHLVKEFNKVHAYPIVMTRTLV